ncbi:hypothetical protein D3C73_695330 [compost metagenome]
MGADKKQRPITYQVGWKKGTIQWNDPGSSPGKVEEQAWDGRQPWPFIVRYGWRGAAWLTPVMVIPLLIALPVACFALTVLLVYKLTHS